MSIIDRKCDLCGINIPNREVFVHTRYRLFVCLFGAGSCADRIKAVERDYSKSRRGRSRTKPAALRLLNHLAQGDAEVMLN